MMAASIMFGFSVVDLSLSSVKRITKLGFCEVLICRMQGAENLAVFRK